MPHMTWRTAAFVTVVLLSGDEAYNNSDCSAVGPRYDCGIPGITAGDCQTRGCCWSPFPRANSRQPFCFTKNAGPSTYKVENTSNTGSQLEATLQAVLSTQPELGPEVEKLSLTVETAPDTIHVKITDAHRQRYEVPSNIFKAADPVPRAWGEGATTQDVRLEFQHTANPFSFAITRQQAGRQDCTFNTSGHRFIFKDQYLEITTSVANSSRLFGLGERSSTDGLALPRDGIPRTLWNRDMPAEFPDQNLYGSHPFLMELKSDGSVSGMFLLSSNAIEAVLTETSVSLRVVGGMLDMYFFAGPTPAAFMEQYTRVIGRPRMPPFWSLGFHQCKYGYKDLQEVEAVVANYSAANIPLDTMWTDIDYMDTWKDFTLNSTTFPLDGVMDFVEGLHAKGMQYVLIADPGIKVEKGYPAYDSGLAADIFIKDVQGRPYMGQVWPGAVHYPDFLNPAAAAYWERNIRDFHEQLPFDGIWIDMNEASNFCTGEVCAFPANISQIGPWSTKMRGSWTDCFLQCGNVSRGANASILSPPYAIDNDNVRQPLSYRTIPMTATHFDGTREFNAHNLYGISESRATAPAMEAIRDGRRSFTLSRSTFPGSGAYAAHWTGDNAATWEDLQWSISSILNSGLSGIPFVGADICGFMRDTTEELCTRWISAGAFYPFTRDHSDLHNTYQELYRWPAVADAGRTALGLRYRLLPYIATAFAAAAATGKPVARPLWFEYPTDSTAAGIDRQWLLGGDILISPVLEQGVSTVSAYFPEGLWYDIFSYDRVVGGKTQTLQAPLGHVPVHMRAGAIIPLQEPALTSAQVRTSPFTLLVALPQQGTGIDGAVVAEGKLFFELGEGVQFENTSVVIGMQVRCGGGSATSCVLQTAILQRPASDLGLACTSVGLPLVERVVLLGRLGNAGNVSISSPQYPTRNTASAGYRTVANVLMQSEPKWSRLDSGALIFENLGMDWNCGDQLLTWNTEI